jgi:hypothetical protein
MRGDDGRISEECENPHLASAGRTEKRQHSIDASEEYCPADACWAGRPGSRVATPDRLTLELARGATSEDPLTVEFPFMRGTRESPFVSAYRASWTVQAPEGTSLTVTLRSEKGGVDRREIVLR